MAQAKDMGEVWKGSETIAHVPAEWKGAIPISSLGRAEGVRSVPTIPEKSEMITPSESQGGVEGSRPRGRVGVLHLS